MARIFISHSSQNNAEALALRDWLVSQGWSDLFLDIDPVSGLVAAQRWQVALRQSIGHCRAVIFCISPEWRASEYCLSEYNEAMHAGTTPVGVVINPIELDRLPPEMTKHWVVDLTRGGRMLSFVVAPPPKRVPVVVRFPEEELQRLRSGLAKLGLVGFETSSFPWPPANEPNRAPYRGLEPLDAQDAGVFFGRDSDLVRVREELLVLRQQGGRRVFAILGASGAGKSSFLRAGILPRLDRESRDYFVLPIIRPADAAITGRHGLAASLEQAFAMVNARQSMGELKQALAEPNSLPLVLTRLHSRVTSRFTGDAEPQIDRPVTLVLAIDQTEELFSTSNSSESNSFLQHLQAAVSNGPEVLALITIRSDRFSILQDSALLKEIPAHLFNLPPVKPDAFREAIVGPAMRVEPPVVLDKRLVDQLTTDSVAQGADPLPLLAFTLERLYLDYGRSTGRLTLENYTSSGGLTGAIDAVLAEAFANPEQYPPIPRDERERESLIDAAFVPALVDINEANDEPLRRIAKEGEIPNAARGLLNRLVEKRLIVRSSRPRSDGTGTETTIEVAHEAILRHWQTLRRILDRKSTELRAIQATEQAATVWQRQDHKAEWLDHKGERLLIAESLARNPAYAARYSGLPAEYLQECRKAQDRAEQDREAQLEARERAQKRAQLFLLGLIALAVALLLGAGWQTRQAARREARVFDSLATKAISEQNYQRAMRLGLQGLPPLGSLPLLEWSRQLEATLARSARLSRVVFVLRPPGGGLTHVALSPHGKRMVTSHADKLCRIWDVANGRQIGSLSGHKDGVLDARFSPNGRLIVTASQDGTARVWDALTQQTISKLRGHSDHVRTAQFSPDGASVLTASDDKTARIWDVTSGRQLATLKGHDGYVQTAEFSPDGLEVVTASTDKTARVWDVASGQELAKLIGHQDMVTAATFSPDGKRIATGSEDNTLRIWDVKSGKQLLLLEGHKNHVRDVRFSPDGMTIASSADDQTIRIWNAETGTQLLVFPFDTGIGGIQFTEDGRRILMALAFWQRLPSGEGSTGGTALMWELESQSQIAKFWFSKGVLAASYDADGKRFIVASEDGTARIVDAVTGQEILVLKGHEKIVTMAAFSPDGRAAITASEDGTARIWNTASGRERMVLQGHDGGIKSARFSPDGAKVVTASEDKTARIWDPATGEELVRIIGHGSTVHDAAFSPDGRFVATASWDGSARVWNAANGHEIVALLGHTNAIDSIAFSPDGKRLVTAAYDRTAGVWDAESGREIMVLRGHEIGVWYAAFSPDGVKFVTASDDGTVRLWDARSGKELSVLRGHAAAVRRASFSPDGTRLLSASMDRTVRVWRVVESTQYSGEALREFVCKHKLVGSQEFTATDLEDPIVAELDDKNPCLRRGPLSLTYWVRLVKPLTRFIPQFPRVFDGSKQPTVRRTLKDNSRSS